MWSDLCVDTFHKSILLKTLKYSDIGFTLFSLNFHGDNTFNIIIFILIIILSWNLSVYKHWVEKIKGLNSQLRAINQEVEIDDREFLCRLHVLPFINFFLNFTLVLTNKLLQ